MNLVLWFAFSVVILIILGIVGNVGATGITDTAVQLHKLSCPMPLGNGVDYLNGTLIYDVDINGNPTAGEPSGGNATVGTFYRCEFDPLSAPPGTSIQTTIKEYGASCFSVFPCGWFGLAQDSISVSAEKIGAFFKIILNFLSPIDFHILGYGIEDLSGIALMVLIGIYLFAYLGIAVFIGPLIIGLVGRLL